MPIAQQRVIALINAASDFEQGLNAAVNTVSIYWKMAHKGQMEPLEALDMIDQIVKHVSLLTHPIDSSKIIALERAHFKANAKRNERAADRKAAQRPTTGQRRQNLGMDTKFLQFTPKRGTSPESMDRDGTLIGSVYQQVHGQNQNLVPDDPLTNSGQKYPMDPSLTEDQELDLTQLKTATPLTDAVKKEIDAEVDALLAGLEKDDPEA